VTATLITLYLIPLVISWGAIAIYFIGAKISKDYIHPDVKLNLICFGAWAFVPVINWLMLVAMLF